MTDEISHELKELLIDALAMTLACLELLEDTEKTLQDKKMKANDNDLFKEL